MQGNTEKQLEMAQANDAAAALQAELARQQAEQDRLRQNLAEKDRELANLRENPVVKVEREVVQERSIVKDDAKERQVRLTYQKANPTLTHLSLKPRSKN